MNFIFAKLYEEYKRKKEFARFSITIYISLVVFFLIVVLLLPVKVFIDKKILDGKVHYEKSIITVVIIVLLAVITFSVYSLYIKKNYIETLTKKYKDKKMNRTILYLIVALTPVILLIIAGTTTVYLNGGKILGHKIQGLLK